MARPYSLDLRERVVAAVESGRTVRDVASSFGVSVSSVVKWSQRYRATGSAAALPMGGRRPFALAAHRGWVLSRLAEKPDLTLRALRAELAARGIVVSNYAVWHFLKAQGITFKKSLHAAEQDRPDVARRRARWKKYQGRLAPGRLVFIDETWVKTNMTRRHGRAQRGQRLVAKAPYGRWRTLTFLAALRVDRIDAPLVLDGPINGRAFTAYVEQFLVPTLAPGDIVIMDNLGSHKGKAVRRAAGLLQAQDPDAKGRRTNRRGHLATRRQAARPVHRPRMRQLHQQRRICFNLKQSRSNTSARLN